MKLLIFVLALSCALLNANASLPRNRGPPRSTGPVLPHAPRFRREVDSQDTVVTNDELPQESSDAEHNKDPLDNEHASVDLIEDATIVPGFHQIDNLNAFGSIDSDEHDDLFHNFGNSRGFRVRREARYVEPRIRFELEKRFGRNGFVTGFTDLQRGARGRGIQPTYGATAGFRFKREAEPQGGSINFHGTQPLSGPDRRPTWDLNANRNILNNGRTTADIYGGLGKVPGQRVQPHIGIQAERNFGKNGFLRGSGQLQPGPGGRGLSPSVGITGGFRFRREADPQRNSINFHGTQPLSGPDRRPTWDLNANRNILNNGRTTADVYGGLGKVPGQRVQPHIGIQAERNFGKNGFLRGSGQLQPGPGGRGLSPSIGITGGFRFRREADPQRNSINFHGTQPLSGPDRRPTWDLNANRNILNNGRTTADIYGGLGKVPGQRVQPHIGIQAERNFGKNGFLRGSGQLQPGPGGRGLSPSVGITGGFRFRREAENTDEVELTEEY